MKNNDTNPNQSHEDIKTHNPTFSALDPVTNKNILHFFTEAMRNYDEAARDQQQSRVYAELVSHHNKSSLLKGMLVGENLFSAKAELKRINRLRKEQGLKRSKWTTLLKEKFGDERQPQNFMFLAKHWHKLEPELERNPNLSLDGALKFLRGEKWPWGKPSEEQKKRRDVYREAQSIFRRCWPVLTNEETEFLQQQFFGGGSLMDDFELWVGTTMNKLRARVRLIDGNRTRTDFEKRFKPLFSDEELSRFGKHPDSTN